MPWNPEQSLFGYFVKSDTGNSVTSAPGLGVTGKGLNAGFRFLSPLPDYWFVDGFTHNASFGADRKDVENAIIAPTARIITPITYIPFSAGYNANLITDNTFTGVRLGLSFNFGGMTPGGSKTDFQINRGGVRANNPVNGTYQIFSGSINYTLRLPALLQTLAAGELIPLPQPKKGFADDWTFNFVMRGQWASQPLISTEQFAAGGVDTVRGYLESEAFGDNAFNVQAELRTPYFRNFLGGYVREAAQLCLFYDGAQLYTLNTGTGPVPSQDLQGVGVGVRASFFDHVQAQFFVAHARTPTFDTGDSEWRYYFQVSAGF
jgi:hemolysin activation/secretion protein